MPVLPHQTWIPTEIMHTPQNMYIYIKEILTKKNYSGVDFKRPKISQRI